MIAFNEAYTDLNNHLCFHNGRPEEECCMGRVRVLALAILDKAEAIYASNYAGASEDDDVAKGFRAFHTDIESLR